MINPSLKEKNINITKIIFINRFYWPDHSATSQLLSDLAPSLAVNNKNFEVHIITSRLLYSDGSVQLKRKQSKNKVIIHRVFTSRFGRSNLFGRAIDYLSFYIFSCIKLFIITNRKCVVVVKTDPPMLSVPCLAITKLRKSKQINWLQDVYPEIVKVLHPNKIHPLILKFLIKIRNVSLKNVDMNVVISDDMKNFLLSEGVSEQKIKVVENWVDTDLIKPVLKKNNSYIGKWGLHNKTVIMYSGNMGRSHYINAILQTAKKFNDNKDIVFLFVGDGAQKVEMQMLAKKLSLNNVMFKGYQSRELLGQSLSVGDVHIVSLKKKLSSFIYPSKLYGIIAVGKPLIFIGDKNSSLAEYVYKNKLGCVVDNNADQIFNAVISIAKDVNNSTEIDFRLRNIAVQKHSFSVSVDKWRLLISSVSLADS